MPSVITRFPPSPTGPLHIGSARTALFNFLFAKQHDGEMFLRFEDTDTERSKKEFEASIVKGLAWLGIEHNGDIYRQSDHNDLFAGYLQKLIEYDLAYEAEDSTDGVGKVIRFRNPGGVVTFQDEIRGTITTDITDLKDFIVGKNNTTPLYNLVVVIDDMRTGITHIIRGEDHISNTPRQIIIREALQKVIPDFATLPQPIYAHIPLILNNDRSKMSKRRNAVNIEEYRDAGYLPEAMLNFLALLGWHPEGEQEIFSLDELVKNFNLSRAQKGAAVFDKEKLDWINKQHLAHVSDEVFEEGVRSFLPEKYHTSTLTKLIPYIRERIAKYSDVGEEDLHFFFQRPNYEIQNLLWKDTSARDTKQHLEWIYTALTSLQAEVFTTEHIREILWEYASQKGKGSVLWPFRYALSGKERSADPFTIAHIIGKDETLERIDHAIQKLS